ncbi:MAG: galactokinase [Verrucomicrobia bacterium]|nr:galactokinase [Verrucomicrobiota bacterium]
MSINPSIARVVRLFATRFGKSPGIIVAAPGRVNLIGEHTDYNDGFVLPMALERRTLLVGSKAEDKQVVLHSLTTGESAEFSLRDELRRGEPGWANYVLGVVAGFRRLGIPVPGFNVLIDSDVPLGGGLSSSAALEVATATFLESLTGHKLDPVQKALLCQKAEHEFAGVPCGIMDQFTSVMARKDHLLLLDCRSQETRFIPVSDPSLAVLIINTNVRHKLADGEYAKRHAECEEAAHQLKVKALRDATPKLLQTHADKLSPQIFRRARHVISENSRTVLAAELFSASQWENVGELMYQSHDSLRDDYEVSCRELDTVVDIAHNIGVEGGVFGCRMTGGGFGGCAVALIRESNTASISRRILDDYECATKILPMLFASRPGEGTAVLLS